MYATEQYLGWPKQDLHWWNASPEQKIELLLTETAYFLWRERERKGVLGTPEGDWIDAELIVSAEHEELWQQAGRICPWSWEKLIASASS